MDPLWLFIALVLGLLAKQFMLPPMVGYLAAGFVLHAMGEQGGELLEGAANLGVLLLLFTIGLKIRPRSFLSPAIWAGTPLHMLTACLVIGVLFISVPVAAAATLSWNSSLLLAFAFSFSSTVLAVKLFEERGEMRTRHAVISVGILIFQDILAVFFLLLSSETPPSLWAFGLLLIPLARPILLKLMMRAGHDEILILFGLTVTVVGASLFEVVGMKDGLGALVFGAMLSNHSKSIELSRALMGFKDIFLIGFFLSIGLIGFPALTDLIYIVAFVAVTLPFKAALFFLIFTRFHLRARTAFLVSLGLSTFSEFGLIVASESASLGWIDERWLVILAIAVTMSFVISSVLNARAHELFRRVEPFLCRFETASRLPEDALPNIGDAEVLVAGMGRVGRSAYRVISETNKGKVCGFDVDTNNIARLQQDNYQAIVGDAEDIEFWRNVINPNIRLIMLSLPTHRDTLLANRWLKSIGYTGHIGAIAKHADERAELLEAGIDAAFDFYSEAGSGFANHVQQELNNRADANT